MEKPATTQTQSSWDTMAHPTLVSGGGVLLAKCNPEARGQESLDESPKGNNTRDTRKEKKDGKGTYRGTFAFYYLQKRRTVSSRNLTVDAL